MSRIGNKPITVPDGVEVKIDGHKITVKGPKGTLEREIHRNISLEMNDNVIKVTRKNDEPANRSLHGLTRTLINNISAIPVFIFDAGISTVLCFDVFAFLILVNISAIGSVVFNSFSSLSFNFIDFFTS